MSIVTIILGICASLIIALVSGLLPSKGKRGERRVSTGLRSRLDATDYQIFDDITLPVKDSTTQIDHLVVSPFGVFVVETKNMSGWIFGSVDKSHWIQVIYKVRHRFQNPLSQNHKHVHAIKEQFGLTANQVNSLVVFVGDCEFKTSIPSRVAIGVSELTNMIRQRTVRILSDQEVQQIINDIEMVRLTPGRETDRIHIQNLKRDASIKANRMNDHCPRCGGKLVERTNRRNGERFLGCSNFPRCKGTRAIQS